MSYLLVSKSAEVSHSLNYLFLIILKQDFSVAQSFSDVDLKNGKGRRHDAIFVHLSEDSEAALEGIRSLATAPDRPVIIALRDQQTDAGANAFLAGADDVVEWPSPMRELAARVSIRLGHTLNGTMFSSPDVKWETEAYIAERAKLTAAEAQVMRVLCSHPGEIVTRDDLSYAVDARPWEYGDRKFDVHVAKIRKKLSTAFGSKMSVSTVRSEGYRLSTEWSGSFLRF